jgi:hypothetical protein
VALCKDNSLFIEDEAINCVPKGLSLHSQVIESHGQRRHLLTEQVCSLCKAVPRLQGGKFHDVSFPQLYGLHGMALGIQMLAKL